MGEYIDDPLDRIYKKIPGSWVRDGELPEADLEIRHALSELKIAANQLARLSWYKSFFNTNEYQTYHTRAFETQERLRELIAKSQEHEAAFYRLMDAAKKLGTGMDKVLRNYLPKPDKNEAV